jgi:hypothetical protein
MQLNCVYCFKAHIRTIIFIAPCLALRVLIVDGRRILKWIIEKCGCFFVVEVIKGNQCTEI